MTGPLGGREILEIGSAVAGPFAGKILADYGANVIKIEPPRGSAMRNRVAWYDRHESDDFTYRFLPYNTGKESLAVDLKTEVGKTIVWKLLDEADVLIESMRPGTMAQLGFGWETVHERCPELVYCSVSGYGQTGPYSQRPAYDPVIQGVSGWSQFAGDREEYSLIDIFIIDHATALYATVGILMALLECGVQNEGQRVNVSMFDTALSFLGHPLAELSAARVYEDVEPSFHLNVEPIGIYPTSDGRLTLLVTPEHWRSFCTAIDRQDLGEEMHRFGTLDGRIANKPELDEVLDQVFREGTTAEWLTKLANEAPGVTCARVNDVLDLQEDPHIQERQSLLVKNHPEMGEYLIPGEVLRFSRTQGRIGHAPRVGEHTDQLLSALGYEKTAIERLRSNGVIK